MRFKNFIENFIDDTLLNSYLIEMAFDRKTAFKKIRSLQEPINNHLMKILKYKDDINFNKHIKDIDKWFLSIQKINVKKFNTKLSKNVYFKLLFEEPFTNKKDITSFNKIINRTLKNYNNLIVLRNNEEVLKLIYNIQKLASILLSNDEFMDFKTDIWNKLI